MRKNSKLEAFRELDKDEQIKIANEKLKKIENPTFEKLGTALGFTNTSEFFINYKINKNKKLELKKNNEVTDITNSITKDDIKILKEVIEGYKLKKELEKEEEEKQEIITRSIRVDKKIMAQFIDFCNKNGLKQMQALNKALSDFINIVNKK